MKRGMRRGATLFRLHSWVTSSRLFNLSFLLSYYPSALVFSTKKPDIFCHAVSRHGFVSNLFVVGWNRFGKGFPGSRSVWNRKIYPQEGINRDDSCHGSLLKANCSCLSRDIPVQLTCLWLDFRNKIQKPDFCCREFHRNSFAIVLKPG